jgi:predicted alpha/beta superfamily hydrolase
MTRAAVFMLTILSTTTELSAQYHVKLEVHSLPAFHSTDDTLYIAGSFNGWNPRDKNYKLQKDAIGHYSIGLNLEEGMHHFKITRGDWKKVECKKDGTSIEDRSLEISTDKNMSIDIEEWADRFPEKKKQGTASPNVHVLDTSFFIPQLKRVRRVWIYLPAGYEISQARYPVLYMQDGQNVFDDATSFAGEWGVDETLDSISAKKRELIVVAVDNGGEKRMNEYCPYDMEKFGKGEGDAYVDFLVNTLKPFIDNKYRTVKDRDNTFIAGSSMGGLISMYAVLKYPKVFGGAGVFSPSFWIAPQIYDEIRKKGKAVNSKIYFYCGKQEGAEMENNMLKVFDAMRKVSKSRMTTVVRPDGKHNEAIWREEFPLFYLWLIEK